MNRLLFTTILAMSAITASAQTWLNKIKTNDIIDSVVTVATDKGWGDYLKMRTYHIYYHQPLQHSNPEGEKFQLRATLTIRNTNNYTPTNVPTYCYIGGYQIDKNLWSTPSYYIGEGSRYESTFELAEHFNANVVQLEHRYFGESCPEKCWTRLEYCTAEEAAADFHAIIEALKESLKGKWIISGVSKGGQTTAYQHVYYPDDADLFVPYAAPFCYRTGDTRMMHYWTHESWTPELRENVLSLQREMLRDKEVFRYFREWKAYYDASKSTTYWQQQFIATIALLDFQLHTYSSRADVTALFNKLDKKLVELQSRGHSRSYLLANLVFYTTLDPSIALDWIKAKQRKAPGKYERPEREGATFNVPVPFSIQENEWDNNITAFYYQSQCELGYFDLDMSAILDAPEDKALADSLNTIWSTTGGLTGFNLPAFKNLTFDRTLNDLVHERTASTHKPLVYMYGGDDTWTGGSISDECINNDNTHKFILPAQNHGVNISHASTDDKKHIWGIIDELFKRDYTAIDGITAPAPAQQGIFTLTGQRVNNPQPGRVYIVNGKKKMVK